MRIREASHEHKAAILDVHKLAFGQDEEALLVEALLSDPSAQPVLSLVAEDDEAIVGHVLFTRVALVGPTEPLAAAILAPLAVVPSAQRSGVGRALIEAGCAALAGRGVQLLFVLGDPNYYNQHGFTAALPHGLRAPYEIHPEAAWMVRALTAPAIETMHATVRCADALAPEKYWRE
jgi:predicted N-acetyltransferase YhbS